MHKADLEYINQYWLGTGKLILEEEMYSDLESGCHTGM